MVTPVEKREVAVMLITEQQCSISKACKVVQLPRSSYQYQKKPKDDSEIQDALTELISKRPAIGFWQSYHRFRNSGKIWNHKRVRRIYLMMKLNIRRESKETLTGKDKATAGDPAVSQSNMEYRLYERCTDRWKKVPVIQRAG